MIALPVYFFHSQFKSGFWLWFLHWFPLRIVLSKIKSHSWWCSPVLRLLVSEQRIEALWIAVTCSSFRKMHKAVKNTWGFLHPRCDNGPPLCSSWPVLWERIQHSLTGKIDLGWFKSCVVPSWEVGEGRAVGFLRRFPFLGFEKTFSGPQWAHLLREEKLFAF